jgi:hypothetical protein
MKTFQRETKFKMGTSNQLRYFAEGRKNMARDSERQEI